MQAASQSSKTGVNVSPQSIFVDDLLRTENPTQVLQGKFGDNWNPLYRQGTLTDELVKFARDVWLEVNGRRSDLFRGYVARRAAELGKKAEFHDYSSNAFKGVSDDERLEFIAEADIEVEPLSQILDLLSRYITPTVHMTQGDLAALGKRQMERRTIN
ncbi:hypothetical protein HYU09_05410 [Candidatus Woesearchaeota archaeon]|nr:hypothetical protein [Candidatus Woesearchaeota archaeon]